MDNTSAVGNIKRKEGKFEKRVHEVDFVRGILILFVLMDHIFICIGNYGGQWYTLTGSSIAKSMAEFGTFYFNHVARGFIRQIILFGFCFVSGLSCAFSRNNWSRACLMIMIAFALTVGGRVLNAVKLFDFNTIIDFNVIHVLAFSTLFYCFVQKQSWKGLLASGLCWFLFSWYGMDILRTIPGFVGSFNPPLIEEPIAVADWMPLVPYIVFFFMGALVTYFIYKDKKSLCKRHEWERPLCYLGRNTMWVYLGHQFVLQGIFMIITAIIKANV